MKVFNLTDIETPALKQRNLCNHTFGVGQFLVEPGQSQEVEEVQIQHIRAGLQGLVAIGALAIGDQPPAAYTVMQARRANKPVTPVALDEAAKAPKPAPEKKSGS